MIGYITLGSNNLQDSATFYDQIFSDIGASRIFDTPSFIAWGKGDGSPFFAITTPFDKKAASVGNGVMIASRCFFSSGMDMSDSIYKVLTQPQWSALESEGEFTGSQDDLEDGFIHLSTREQYNGVIDRFFKGIKPLYIVEFSAADFGDALKWEPAKSGELFPHVYNRPLKQTEMLGVEVLE